MLFFTHLYNIVSSAEEEQLARYQISLNREHAIFAAHFPGEPILPGACIVQILSELAGVWQKREMPVIKMSQVKFLSIISPTQVTQLEVLLELHKHDEKGLQLRATLKSEEIVYAKMMLLFAYDK